jgi:hypothetical protein
MYRLRQSELSSAEGNAGRGPAGIEKVLPEGTQAHSPQGIQKEVRFKIADCQRRALAEKMSNLDQPHPI